MYKTKNFREYLDENNCQNESITKNDLLQANELKNKIEQLETDKKNLETQIFELKTENKRLKEFENEITILKNKLNEYENANIKLINQNNELFSKAQNLENLLNEEKSKNSSNNKDKIIELLEELKMKEKEIKELKSIIPYNLKNGENLMSVIFYSEDKKIHYSFICKNTDKFNIIEEKLYEIYPEYRETENFFMINEKKINRFKTMDENNIKFSDIIILNKRE